MTVSSGTSKLMDTWAFNGPKVEPDQAKKDSGWLYKEQPPNEYMNWLQNMICKQVNYAIRCGIPEWHAETEYLKDDYARVGADVYYALVPNKNQKPPCSAWARSAAGVKADAMGGMPPVGSIIAYVPGHFINASNGGFTCGLEGNDVASVNAQVNPAGWWVADGSVLQVVGSKYFSEPGKHLPNLSGERFLMGATSAGVPGGQNTNSIAHYHTTGDFALSVSHMPGHSHTITINKGGTHNHGGIGPRGQWLQCSTPPRICGSHGGPGDFPWSTGYAGEHSHSAVCSYAGSGLAHNHGNTGVSGNEALENRPRYLTCFYLVRVF